MEEKEYEIAVSRYLDDLYRFACSVTGNEADAADVVQVVFMKLASSEKEFESGLHLKNWLLKCAANESKSLLRSYWRKHVFSQEDWMENQAVSEDPSLFYIRDLVSRLSKKDRVIVSLYYWQGYDHKEIGRLLNMNPSAVSTRLMRIRRKLKTMFTDEEENDERNR